MTYSETIVDGDNTVAILFTFEDLGEVRSYYIRHLTPNALHALQLDTSDAYQRGEDLEAVAAAWTLMQET